MKTLVVAAIAALTLTLAASAGPNDDFCPTFGCGNNGTSLNGIWSNGTTYQGSSLQGMNMQGTRTHGAPAEVTIGSAVLVRIELPR